MINPPIVNGTGAPFECPIPTTSSFLFNKEVPKGMGVRFRL